MQLFNTINKDLTIQHITTKIFELFDDNFFDTYIEKY